MTKEQFESRYNEIENAAELQYISWKSAMARAAMLGTEYGRSQGDAVVKRLDALLLSIEENFIRPVDDANDESVQAEGVVDADLLLMDLQQVRNG